MVELERLLYHSGRGGFAGSHYGNAAHSWADAKVRGRTRGARGALLLDARGRRSGVFPGEGQWVVVVGPLSNYYGFRLLFFFFFLGPLSDFRTWSVGCALMCSVKVCV